MFTGRRNARRSDTKIGIEGNTNKNTSSLDMNLTYRTAGERHVGSVAGARESTPSGDENRALKTIKRNRRRAEGTYGEEMDYKQIKNNNKGENRVGEAASDFFL
jgi:hypothetical protein